jgi:hypothetical protein
MMGWRNGAVALAVVILAMCASAPAFAGDTTVAVQRLGPTQLLLQGAKPVPVPMPQPPQYPNYPYGNSLSVGPNGPR